MCVLVLKIEKARAGVFALLLISLGETVGVLRFPVADVRGTPVPLMEAPVLERRLVAVFVNQ